MQPQIYDNVYVVRDPILKSVGKNGNLVAQASIGFYTKIKADGENDSFMSFINIEAWNKTAEQFVHQVRRGTRITLTGFLHQKRWRDAEGKVRQQYAINVLSFGVIEHKEKAREAAAMSEGPTFTSGLADDDIPF